MVPHASAPTGYNEVKTAKEQEALLMAMTTEQIWEAFHPQLKHFILTRVPDEPSADDILQEVFLKIHTHIDTLHDQEKLESWLYQITRNTITDYYRTHKATVELSEALLLPEEPVVEDDVVKELIPSVKAMVESLPDDYREALLFTEYEGLTQKELTLRPFCIYTVSSREHGSRSTCSSSSVSQLEENYERFSVL
jgi:RNA polymerase sigma factor (sigma-70 family)